MPLSRGALIALTVILMWTILAAPADAQQNPLLGGPPPTSAVVPSAPATPGGGLLHRIGREVVTAQAYFTRQIDRQLVAIRDGRGLAVVLGGLLVAFLYGVLHALGPGHGKTVILGYFVGRGGTPWRGLAMAAWISVSHTIGAILIVGVAHVVFSRTLLTPVEEDRWLKLVSYGAILAIGLVMLARSIADKGHRQRHDCGHDHAGRREQQLLAVAAGFLPCSGAVLILLFAFGNGMLGIGILMTLSIAVGMGLTLAALGMVGLLTHRYAVARLQSTDRARALLGLLGPVLICAIGVILFSGAVLEQSPL